MSAAQDPARAGAHGARDLARAGHSGVELPVEAGVHARLKAELLQVRADLDRAEAELESARKQLSRERPGQTSLLTMEARLHLAMEAANIGFWDWDPQTNATYHSPEWKRQLGYEDHELTNALEEWQNRLHPDDAPRVRAAVATFLAKNQSDYDMEFRLLHRDGSYRWVHSQGRLFKMEGNRIRLLGVHVDITAAKEREMALRESEQRFRRLVETTPIIPWEADPGTWRFTYIGPRASAILGYPTHEWFADDFWVRHIHPDDRETATACRRDHAAQRDDFESEYRMVSADGRSIWFHDVVHVAAGAQGAAKLQGFLIDITERKRAAEEHSRLAAIVESSNDAIIGETLDGIITTWNKSAERIYGYPAEEAIDRSVNMLVPRERGQELLEILARVKRGEMIEHMETVRLRKDGRPIHVSLVVSPIRDVTGKIYGASAIARDITQRKQLESEVLQISEREQHRIARDLHDGLGQLLSGTAHLSTVLQQELADQALPEAAEALRVTELLNQAVAETRCLARGLYPVTPEQNGLMVALEELTNRTAALFRVSCRFHCRKPVLFDDCALATHLYRIAQEAITNALKHGKARQIHVSLTARAGRIDLSIRDNGNGLPADAPNRNGMGIRIMHYRAAMVGGVLAIDSEPDGGVAVVCTVHRPRTESGHNPEPCPKIPLK